jgi:hypothetical protein
MMSCWLATQAPATFYNVLVARLTPVLTASSKLFLEEAMISVTRATEDIFRSASQQRLRITILPDTAAAD